jgi:hypothetical protein
MADQYAFIYPGEKLYVLVQGINGSNDYIHVVQIDFPTTTNDLGDTIIDGAQSPQINAQYDLLESNDAANLQDYSDNNTVLGGYQKKHREQGGKGRVGMTVVGSWFKRVGEAL